MSKSSTCKYKNITISGLTDSESTTLLGLLKRELEPASWRGFSGGQFMREYAAEKGLFDGSQGLHHHANVYEDDFDRKVDLGMREKLQTQDKWILESWLSGFMAQGVKRVLKVLMICSNDAIRIDRVVNRDTVSVKKAKHHILDRYQSNLEKWARMYKKEWQEWVVKSGKVDAQAEIDFWRPDLYDIVIDTYSHNKEESLQFVLDAIKKNT